MTSTIGLDIIVTEMDAEKREYKPGAPPGGRVHWFIWNLPRTIKQAYTIEFEYDYHNYRLSRTAGRTLIDEFIVIRTSRTCWRCMYWHRFYKVSKYFSEKTSKKIGWRIFDVYIKIRQAELKQDKK